MSDEIPEEIMEVYVRAYGDAIEDLNNRIYEIPMDSEDEFTDWIEQRAEESLSEMMD